ncbi:MAG: transporter substrate-binding protein [Frankiales bacterium]|nr:transporter substrate-binding protein [Frankiales bacterium]
MISRQTKLQLLVFGIVAVLGLVYAGGRYAGLGVLVPGHDKGFLVKADFVDSGGIFKGAEVNYRGISVGKVESLKLLTKTKDGVDGVQLGLRLKPGTKLPKTADPSAKQLQGYVDNRSAVGEQFVDLQPAVDQGPLLKGGDTIGTIKDGTILDTHIPIQPTQLILNLDTLVKSVNTADVTVVLNELGKAFEGSGTDLQRLIDAGDQLTLAATQNLPQTLKLIQDSKPVLDTQRAVASDFKSYNASLASLSAQLRASDPDFRALFKSGTDSANVTKSLLDANQASLPLLLGNLVSTAQIQSVRIPALRQILVTYPNVVAGGFTVTPGDGTAHFGLATTMNPPACTKGYETTKKRDPQVVTPRPSNTKAYCAEPPSSGIDVRGAAAAPRAEGLRPFPYDANAANKQASLYAGATGTDGFSTTYADYDPSTGHAITADGARYTLGSTAGAQDAFGTAAWEWLLLDPLRTS